MYGTQDRFWREDFRSAASKVVVGHEMLRVTNAHENAIPPIANHIKRYSCGVFVSVRDRPKGWVAYAEKNGISLECSEVGVWGVPQLKFSLRPPCASPKGALWLTA